MRRIILILIVMLSARLFAQNKSTDDTFILVNVSAITPIGIFAENWNVGGGLYLGYGWRFANEWEYHFQAGYNRYRLISDSDYSNSPKLSMFAFQIGGRHYFMTESFKPYIAVLSGVNIIHLFYNLDENHIDEKSTHLNFQMGGGIVTNISSNLELDLSVLYNSHLINPNIPYNLTGFEFGFGAKWILD